MSEPSTELLNEVMLSQATMIAKGLRIREVRSLSNTYGDKTSGWMKKSSPVFVFEDEEFEFRWYERPGLRIEVEPRKVNEP